METRMRNRFRPGAGKTRAGNILPHCSPFGSQSNAHARRENCSRTDLARFPVETAASVSAREVLRLITRIDNSCAQSSAFGAVFQAVNGCAAHPSPQVLTLRAETCSLFIEITRIPVAGDTVGESLNGHWRQLKQRTARYVSWHEGPH